jgi:murein DD-endopeptidase MepM/ murein hydrolase activator NlpD
MLRNLMIRWTAFFIVLAVVYFVVNSKVHAVAQASLQSALTVTIPVYTKDELVNSIESRLKYLYLRTKGVKFYVYKVNRRENLWTIAKKYGYSVHTIIGCNPQLKTYNINEGQKLLIPNIGGTLHPVHPKDTLKSISEQYGIEQSVLKNTNFMLNDDLEKEIFIFVPGKRPLVNLLNENMQQKYALRDLFISPLGGRISSPFGKRRHPVTGKSRRHGGIDIAVREGSAVGAAASGVVILASYDVGHYGVAVFIDHQNGYITHYGHLSKIFVRQGQKVRQGQIIAKSGSTGRSTGPHLHFTVKRNGVNVDPLQFLW